MGSKKNKTKPAYFCILGYKIIIFFSQQKNPFAGSSTNLDDLIKCTAPPSEKVRRNNSMSTVVTPSYRAFDEVYKDLKPSKPLQHTEFSKMSDIVKQQCFQTQDLRLQDRKGLCQMLYKNIIL